MHLSRSFPQKKKKKNEYTSFLSLFLPYKLLSLSPPLLSDNLFFAQLWYIALYKFSSIWQIYHNTLQWDLRLSLQGIELEHCKLHVSLFFLVKNKKKILNKGFFCFCFVTVLIFFDSFVEPSAGMVDIKSTAVAISSKFIKIWIFSNRWYFFFG